MWINGVMMYFSIGSEIFVVLVLNDEGTVGSAVRYANVCSICSCRGGEAALP